MGKTKFDKETKALLHENRVLAARISNQRLKSEWSARSGGGRSPGKGKSVEMEAALERIDTLRAALKTWGRHDSACATLTIQGDCDCDFVKVLRMAARPILSGSEFKS